MRRHSYALLVSLVLSALVFSHESARAQSQSSRAGATAAAASANNPAIPSPESSLGFVPGTDRTIADWKEITAYFARLDAASDRLLIRTLGQSTGGRPLFAAFISAPENIRDLEKYKEIQGRLADPRTIKTEAERDSLLQKGRTVVAVSCSIHSDEIVASQMSMQLAYELASAEDEETREILQNTILILIPSPNPDGVQIVADWYRRTLGTPYEGRQPPQLYHTYAGHDNNRDWFMLNLKETRLVTQLFWKEWFPQIVYDVHQQGMNASRFFVPPFYDPANPAIAPVLLRQVGLLGHKIAADLQARGTQGVITNAVYDTWWHGGFRTAPYYHNSIGILTEAASARLMSPVTVTREQLQRSTSRGMPSALQPATNFPAPWPGGLWRPRDIMQMELVASRAILSMAAKFRADYLRNFYNLNLESASAPIREQEPLAYLIPAGQGRDENVAKLVSTLVAQGVEVHQLDRELHAALATQALRRSSDKLDAALEVAIMEKQRAQEVPAGSYLVYLQQPQRANVRALFEPQAYPDRRMGRGEVERPYDVAGWTLPLQMGVETYAVTEIKEAPRARRLSPVRDEREVRRALGLPVATDARSPIANPVTRPVRLALYRGWMASMDEGWTRYVFDQFNIPYETLRDADVRRGSLRARYDVIVLPSQKAKDIIEGHAPGTYPPEFTEGITRAGVESLRSFVNEGGTLVCFDAASELAIEEFNLPLRNVLKGVPQTDFYCPGSILQLDVDASHTIARGMQSRTPAYFINSSAFELNSSEQSERVRVIARYAEADRLLRSGWLLGASRIAGRIALAEVQMGQGRVVLFAFRPQHRAQTWATFPFIFNAIMTGKA
ncbi:MAG TPA: M14 family metallopeptidase [Pyrinomonadaceae bacterium]|nr:M14 family metallopeptidase [Pyrinomonadaceae bacterium]